MGWQGAFLLLEVQLLGRRWLATSILGLLFGLPGGVHMVGFQ